MSQFFINSGISPGEDPILFLQGNTGGPVGPNGSGVIDVVGTGSIAVAGNSATNTLTISVSGSGFTWSVQNTSFAAAVQNGYIVTAAATATLPASPSQGDTIVIGCATSSSVVIQANTGQRIRVGNTITTLAGSSTSTTIGNSMTLTFISSGSTWACILTPPQGTWTLTT